MFTAIVNTETRTARQKALIKIFIIYTDCLHEHGAHADHPLPESRPKRKLQLKKKKKHINHSRLEAIKEIMKEIIIINI